MVRATGVGFVLGLSRLHAGRDLVHLLRPRAARVEDAGALRQGRHRRRGGARGRQQRHHERGFVPLFALGIPATPALAVVLSGLMIYGLQPGPLLFEKQPQFVWTVIASMYVGNVMLLVLNLPLVGLWARLCRIPYALMAPLILMFSVLGAYSVRNSFADVGMALGFGLLGYAMAKLGYPTAPLVLALILTPMLESGCASHSAWRTEARRSSDAAHRPHPDGGRLSY
jgi:putative tricarboxylic transport membrane protein